MAKRMSKSVLMGLVLFAGALFSQAGAIAVLAAREMIPHRLACTIGVAGGDRIENAAMLFVQADLIFIGQHALRAPGRRHIARNGAAAQSIEHLEIEGVIGRRRNGAVKSAQVQEYLHVMMAHLQVEQFRILFLDKRNRLLADEVQQTGTVDHAPVYPREVVRRSLELSATAIILVHNHPSGDPSPSTADIRMTKEIAAAAQAIGIAVHDHVIVGRLGVFTLRGAGMI